MADVDQYDECLNLNSLGTHKEVMNEEERLCCSDKDEENAEGEQKHVEGEQKHTEGEQKHVEGEQKCTEEHVEGEQKEVNGEKQHMDQYAAEGQVN